MSGFELLKRLKELGYLKEDKDPYWWPNSGSFEVVVGAILTQNSRWENVEKALNNLKNSLGELSLQVINQIDQKELSVLIKPAGFYNTKAYRLKKLCFNIEQDYGEFEFFKKKVSRSWLLNQKGVGFETADTILNYACYKEFLVVDNYTAKLLNLLGYEFESYPEIQEYLSDSIIENLDKVYDLYGKELPLSQIYARFHGKIVEFSKDHKKSKPDEVRKILGAYF
ncbi:MAG: 3-methyladenine DNA glycosylase [Epsilonproteobacteria bacterium]|nr:3-methyladenine DNA glycosylase [Campylobacterota bacterium]